MSPASKHRIYFLLQRVAHRLKKKADSLAMEAGGMTSAQATVLSIIINEGGASQAQIAKQLSQRESAITTMAARLEEAGYITKEQSESDRRTWILESTAKGRKARDAMMKALGEANLLLDSAVPSKSMDALAKSLQDILTALDDPEL